MENLTAGSEKLHGEHGRCMFVADRKCGPGCQGFDHDAQCCGLVTGINLLLVHLEVLANAMGRHIHPQRIPPRHAPEK